MPREIITIQVGQCGNQIGCRFWDLALREHAAYSSHGRFDDAASSFFQLSDKSDSAFADVFLPGGKRATGRLKARAVLIDMEESVVNDLLRGPLSDIFDTRQHITNVSGSGNNWAHGHELHASRHGDEIMEKVRRQVEACESLQSFFMLHSLGGGTGSGVGSFVLEALQEAYPEVYRFTASIFPSGDDDVVTSPYNSLLSLMSLAGAADCVFPIENQALLDICRSTAGRRGSTGEIPSRPATSGSAGARSGSGKPFDEMNNIAANLLLHLTASVRFEGPLNVDLNDVTMNLVPFPRLHFLASSMSPVSAPHRTGATVKQPRGIDEAFTDCFARDHQLTTMNPLQSTYLACALVVRGPSVSISDINHNIARMKQRLRMVHWNMEGFKLGLCLKPPVGRPYALMCLANNTCMGPMFASMKERFNKLYARKVFVHHYTQYMPEALFTDCLENASQLIGEYEALDAPHVTRSIARMRPVLSAFG